MIHSALTARARTAAHRLWLVPWMAAVAPMCSCDSMPPAREGIESSSEEVAPDPVCTSCLEAPIEWGYRGGLTAFAERSSVEPCRTYHRERRRHGEPEAEASCSALLPCDASDIGVRRLRQLFRDPDVQHALASPAPSMEVFGCDERPVDAPLFVVESNGRSFGVGSGCAGCALPCRTPPPGVRKLVQFLRALDDGMEAREPCRSAFGSR